MKNLTLLFLSAFFSFQVQAGVSAKRPRTESISDSWSSARLSALHLSEDGLSESQVVEWSDYETLQNFFEQSRDERFLTDSKNFSRRISWLYPDDGCFARAALVIKKAQEKMLPLPNRVFIYGNLEAYTSNSPNYSVTWWYHTAPIVKVEGRLYVMDAALDAEKPMPLEDWIKTQTARTSNYDVRICGSHTYDPRTPCTGDLADDSSAAMDDIQIFLPREWRRQIELKRDPELVLGEAPPWRTSKH